jgi:nickel transport protein
MRPVLRLLPFIFFIALSAHAHDYWFERDAKGYALFQGHVFSSHEGEARVPYDPSIVLGVQCLRPEGDVVAPALARAYPVRIEQRCAAVLARTNSGYWTQTLNETLNRPKSQVPGAIRGWLAQETIKRVDAWSAAASRPISDGLELTPLDDPFALKPGDKLRVLVTWRGKPRRGVAVAYDGDTRGATASDGLVNIRIRHPGTQILSASFEENVRETNADKIVHGSILQFELK